MAVPEATPGPVRTCPTAKAPDVSDVTVKVVPEIDPAMRAGAAEPASDVELTVCETLTVYVPTPPTPVPNPVMTVPADTPVPVIFCPTTKVPDVTAETVRVVPEIEPVT